MQIPDQTCRVVVIKGADSGIGLEAARVLVAKGAALPENMRIGYDYTFVDGDGAGLFRCVLLGYRQRPRS